MYPAISSDSASAKSNGARLVSNKNAIIIKPVNPKNIKISQIFSCTITKAANENDSVITTQLIINKPKNNSRFNINTPHLIEAKKAYLFLLKYPVSITQYPNNKDNNDAYTTLYSNSNILKLGPQIEFIQNV